MLFFFLWFLRLVFQFAISGFSSYLTGPGKLYACPSLFVWAKVGLVNWTEEPASELALKHYIQNNLVKGTAQRIAKNETLYFLALAKRN